MGKEMRDFRSLSSRGDLCFVNPSRPPTPIRSGPHPKYVYIALTVPSIRLCKSPDAKRFAFFFVFESTRGPEAVRTLLFSPQSLFAQKHQAHLEHCVTYDFKYSENLL